MADRDVPQHPSQAARVAAAHAFLADFPLPPSLPLFADHFVPDAGTTAGSGSFNAAYASWPFRFWALLPPTLEARSGGGAGLSEQPLSKPQPVVGLKPMPFEGRYRLSDLEQWLAAQAADRE